MKTRLILIGGVLLLSLSLVTIALTSASAAQTVAMGVQTLDKMASSTSIRPNSLEGRDATYLSSGLAWSAPRSPDTPGEWDSLYIRHPRVILDGGQYHLWYNGRNPNDSESPMGLADSPDGVTWTKFVKNPILKSGEDGEWDSDYRGQAAFLIESGIFKMWYSGGGPDSWQTGYATSTNAIDWNIYGGNPVLLAGGAGEWDEAEADAPSVIHDGSTYKMWFHGCNTDYSACAIGYATSTDGVTWTKDASNPVLTGSAGDWDEVVSWPQVIKNGVNSYQMWYYGGKSDGSSSGIGLATSTDGINWTKYAGNPVLSVAWDGNYVRGHSVILDGSTYKMWFSSGAGDTGIGYAESTDGIVWTYPVSNPVLTPGSAGLVIQVNYTHNWVYASTAPNTAITITVADANGVKGTQIGWTDGSGQFNGWEWPWDDPKGVDILPGDAVTATAAAMSTWVNPVGEIDGYINIDTDIISGSIQAPWFSPLTLTVWCNVKAENGPPGIMVQGVPADGGNYLCDFGAEGWDLQPGQQVFVSYAEPDADQVMVVLEAPWMRVNYAHNWAAGNYPAGHTFWITVTNDLGEVRATTQVTSELGAGWGGGDGFDTKNFWIPQQPDIQEGDWVYFHSDDGYDHAIHVGIISGAVDVDTDSVAGNMYVGWFTQTLNVECDPWGSPGPAPSKFSTAGPEGDPPYFCQWDPLTEWDIQPGQDVAVMYIEPDGDRVMNVFQEPAPHLWIKTWANGTPGEGGNLELSINYNNDGQAPAQGLVITSTLEGMDYLGDTSGFSHTGSGAPGDPLVWDVGYLPPSYMFNQQFLVFVAVTAPASQTITHTVDIETTPPGFQGDSGSKHNWWSGHVEPGAFDLNVGTWIWTWDPVPGTEYIYDANVCQSWGTGSGEVVLTDTLPLSTTLVSWWSQYNDWTEVASSPQELVVSRPTISSGCSEVYLRVFLDPSAWQGMPLSSTATIAVEDDADPNNNTSTVWHNVGSPHYNLSLYPNWHWGALVPGGNMYYEMRYQNNGNLPVDDLLITATLPVSTTFDYSYYSTMYGWHPVTPTVVVPGEYVVWDFGPIDNGYGNNLGIVLTIDPGAAPGTALTLTAQVNTLPVEDDFDDNALTWVDTLNDYGPNLRVEKWFNYWQDDGTLSFETHALNMGTERLENVWITDTYPVSTTFTGDWNVGHGPWVTYTHDAANRTLSFLLSGLNPGETANVCYRLDLDGDIIGQKGLTFVNTADAPIPGDVFPADNQDQVTAFTGPDLYVEKTLMSGEVLPGELVTFDLKFGNDQNPSAGWWNLQGNAWLTDTLPEGMTFVSSEIRYCGETNWCNFAPTVIDGDMLAWQLWPMKTSEHNEIRLTVRLADTLSGQDTLVNQTVIASDQPWNDIEPDYANNAASLSLPVALPYFEIGKVVESSQVAGMPALYTLTVSNTGHEVGTTVEVGDWIPGWLDYGGGGSYSAGLITWTIPTIHAWESATVWFTGTLSCSVDRLVNNQDYFVESSDQGVVTPNGEPVRFTIQAPSILAQFTASAESLLAGETVYFTSTSTTDGTPLEYAWDFGDGGTASGALASHVFAQAGSYPVTLTVTDACGFSETYTLTIEVLPAEKFNYLPLVYKH